ncbi:BACON domain-containing carbohydrate-binding protein [Bacteroides sp. CR5/BHMF/2]|nr:BACON domain-containing carbohydrate-binding protein [Bacteroides sp. CR5/BHMF/2]
MSGKDGDVVTFTIDPNTQDEKRTATFKFFTGSAVAPLQVETLPDYIIDLLSDDNLSISREENAIQIQLNTNIAEPVITYSEGVKNGWHLINGVILVVKLPCHLKLQKM